MDNNRNMGRLRKIDDLELTKALWTFDERIVKPRTRIANNTRKRSRQLFHIKPNHWTWRTWTITAALHAQNDSTEPS